ncbi:amidohydrolase family protein [Planctomycetaceae bacterium SH139]
MNRQHNMMIRSICSGGALTRRWLNCCLLVALCALPAAADDVYFADQIWTGEGEPIRNAAMVVSGGKIVAVGPRGEVEIPSGAVRHELGSAQLVPGIVASQTTIAENGRDEEESVTPYIRAVDGFDFFGEYDSLLAAGVTTAQLSPGSQRIMPGQGAVIKLAGDDPVARTLNEQESLRVILTQAAFNPPRIYEPPVGAVSVDRPFEVTRPQLASNLGDAIAGLRALLQARQAPEASDDLILSAIDETVTSGRKVRMTVRTAAEIIAAKSLAEEFELPLILIGLDELSPVATAVAWADPRIHGLILETGAGLDRLSNLPIPGPNSEQQLEPWQRLELLAQQGVLEKVALTADDGDWADIWFSAGRLLAAEISHGELLKMLTATPAKMMDVNERVGTLSVGKDADFVILSGRPFDVASRVTATYVDGKQVYDYQTADETKVIRGATVYTPSGPLADASITVRGTKIRGVGSSVSFPADAEINEFPGAVIVPGFIDLQTQVGVGGGFSDRVSLGDKFGPLLVSDDASIAMARQGGITTGLLSSTSLPSPVLAFKLADQPRVLADPVAIRYAISGNLTTEGAKLRSTFKVGKAYVDSWKKYDAEFAEYEKKLAAYEQAKAKYDAAVAEREKKAAEAKKAEEAKKDGDADKDAEKDGEAKSSGDAKPAAETKEDKDSNPANEADKKSAADSKDDKNDDSKEQAEEKLVAPEKPAEPKKPSTNAGLEPYKPLFAGEIAAIVEVDSGKSLELAVEVFVDEYKIRTVLAASGTADREAELLADKPLASVVLTPPLMRQEQGQTINVAERFISAGAAVTIASGAGTGAKNMPTAVAYAVYRGLGQGDALAALTTVPAKVTKLTALGSIAPAKDADLVVLSGPPFQADSRVLAVMIDGQWVYRADDQQVSNQDSNE